MIGVKELAHAEEIRTRVAPHAGITTGEIRGEFFDHAVTPLGVGDLPADVLAELPVERHQLRVDRLVRAPAGSLNERDDFREARLASDNTCRRLALANDS